MPEKFRRYFLKTKDAKAFLDSASKRLGIDLEQIFRAKVNVELIQTIFADVYLINSKPTLAKTKENLFPTLTFSEFFNLLPKVFVDMGAVPHVCNGADIMAPGIIRYEGAFRKGEFVFIVDGKHGKPIAVGESLYNIGEAKKVTHGIVVKNIHFVGDRLWNFYKKFLTASFGEV